MTDVVERLTAAMNRHDLEGAVALVHEDYRSEQPAHPGRAFVGRHRMRANWAAMFAGIPDFQAEQTRSVRDGDTIWSEWRWTGTRTDGEPFGPAAESASSAVIVTLPTTIRTPRSFSPPARVRSTLWAHNT